MKYDTRILHGKDDKDPVTGALSIPIYNASTYNQKDIDTRQEFDYSRSGNPTRKALEATLAELENAQYGYAFASGVAAIFAALSAILTAGDHVVLTENIYGGTYRMVTQFLSRFNISHTFVNTSDPQATEQAIRPNTKVLFLESPSNPLLHIIDFEAMSAIASKYKLISMVDNTFLSPYYFKPLDWGIDISIHSATKFLGGHSDLLAGSVMTKNKSLAEKIYFVQNTCGSVLGPQDSWLLLRGIKTLSARMTLQTAGAMSIATWLQEQSWVSQVFYPGLVDHPGHDIISRQASGYGCVVSFKTDTSERSHRLMKHVKLWTVAVSLGGVESILSYPSRMSHAAIPAAERLRLGITENLIRLSIGLEDAEDLRDDLATAAG